MNRLFISAATIVAVGTFAVASTGAFFSDTETSTGNTFTAGDIDLQIDNESYVTDADGVLKFSPTTSWAMNNLTSQLFFNFADVKPGDVGEDTISVHAGSNNAWACMALDVTGTPENTLVEPETDAGDAGPANGDNGELQNFLHFTFWYDDGDNVFESDETPIPTLNNVPASDLQGAWHTVADSATSPIPGNSTRYIAKAWCFGNMTPDPVETDLTGHTGSGTGDSLNGPVGRGTGFVCDGSGPNNIAQTDGVTMTVAFQATQSRNNPEFLCSDLSRLGSNTITVRQNNLATLLSEVVNDPTKWFFYNDTSDTVMTIDQFSGTGGQNHMESVAGSAGAKMVLDSGVNPRYNIATAKYGNVALSTISNLKYRIYDTTADSDKPFLHFNVDFTGSNSFQGRLVYVPTGLTTDTWTLVDTIQGGTGQWLYSGAFWPAGVTTVANTIPGTTARSWSSILADYPVAKTLAGGAFLGVRVGEPGPTGATGFVDRIEFNADVNDFEL